MKSGTRILGYILSLNLSHTPTELSITPSTNTLNPRGCGPEGILLRCCSLFSKHLLQLHKRAGVGHIRWKQAPEEIRTHLGQELGGSHIHPEQQGLHRQEQVLAQGHMTVLGQGQGHKRELGQESRMEQGQVLVQNRTGQGQK